MNGAGDVLTIRRRTGQLLLGVLALFAVHRVLAVLAARPLGALLRGYPDADLLAAGGDLMLELVLQHQHVLPSALGTAGLWLICGRALVFVATFLVHVLAFSLATTAHGPRSDTRRLHVGWALLLFAGTSLASGALLAPLAWAGVRLGRWLPQANVTDWPTYLAAAALVAALAWLLCVVWFDLFRLAVAGARLHPLAAAKVTAKAWRLGSRNLLAARFMLALGTIAITGLCVLMLPVVTTGSSGQRAFALLAIDLGLLGSVCLRAAWLTWASAHLAYCQAAELKPASSEAVPPSAEPAVPADPSPSPDA
jgi:hypothetical protein